MAKIVYGDKIYTCNFRDVGKHVNSSKSVSIAVGQPNTFKGVRYTELMPPWILVEGYKTGKISKEDYIEVYNEQVLGLLDPIKVYDDLKGKVLCCWEKKGDFCHRTLVLDWLKRHIGEHIIGGEL